MLKSRTTHSFIEIKADELELTVFKSDGSEANRLITELLSVVRDIAELTGKSLSDVVKEYES